MIRLLMLPLFLLITSVHGEQIFGTGWFFEESDGDKVIILFEKDGTFTYLDVTISSGGEGEVYSDDMDTYLVSGDRVVISFSDGYLICSLTMGSTRSRMSGTCLNQEGTVEQITGRRIE